MYLKGFKVSRCKTVGFRTSKPTDLDLFYVPIDPHNVAFVQISDCEIKEEDGKKYYIPDNAPAIPLTYGGTYYGYGKWRLGTKGRYFHVPDASEPVFETRYLTCPVYFAKDGQVFTGTNYLRIQDATAKALLQAGFDNEKRQNQVSTNYKQIIQHTLLEHGKKMLATELKV